MQSRTLIQGCHELSREETFEIRARVVVLTRSKRRDQPIYFLLFKIKFEIRSLVSVSFLNEEFCIHIEYNYEKLLLH